MKRLCTFLICILPLLGLAQTYTLSPSFGEDGIVRNALWSGSEQFNSHALQPDGKLLLAGYGYWSTPNSFRIKMMRIDTVCGAADPEFGNNGALSFTFEQRTTLYDIALQPDGHIVGCGMIAPSNAGSQQKPGVFRLMPDGSADETFNESGYHRSGFDAISSGRLFKAFVAEDGRITCTGVSTTNINGGTVGIGAQRFLANGTLDTTFSEDGLVRRGLSGTGYTLDGNLGSGIMQPDSMVIAVAVLNASNVRRFAMVRFTYDGSPDTTFGDNGLVITDVLIASSQFPEDGIGAALQDDGRILLSGRSPVDPHHFLMARFLPDGTIDETFGVDGISLVAPPGSTAPVGNRMSLLPDGSTLQFGAANWNSGPPAVVKRLADGTADPDFGTNGALQVPTGVSNEKFWGGFGLPDGRIMAYGGGAGSVIVARLTQNPDSDGFVDLGGDQSICEGQTVVFDAGNPGSSYVWNNGTTLQTLEAGSSGEYSVAVTNALGCTDSDEVTLTVFPLPEIPVIESANGFELTTSSEGNLQWYLDGNPIPEASETSYTATETGVYTVEVTDENGCSSISDPFDVSVLSANDIRMEKLHLWPNPAKDLLNVPTAQIWSKAEAIDLAGRSILLHSDRSGRIQISSLEAGTYLLRLESSESVVTGRFVKL